MPKDKSTSPGGDGPMGAGRMLFPMQVRWDVQSIGAVQNRASDHCVSSADRARPARGIRCHTGRLLGGLG